MLLEKLGAARQTEAAFETKNLGPYATLGHSEYSFDKATDRWPQPNYMVVHFSHQSGIGATTQLTTTTTTQPPPTSSTSSAVSLLPGIGHI